MNFSLLRRGLFFAFVSFALGAEPPVAPAAHKLPAMEQVWFDVPAYLALTKQKRKVTKQPQLVSSVPPQYPPVYLATGTKVRVDVAMVVDAQGAVEAARVASSDDHRFDDAALRAVKQWIFRPGEADGQPAQFMMLVPITFDGCGARVLPLEIAATPVRVVKVINAVPEMACFHAELKGEGVGKIKAARLTVTRAIDGTGHALRPHARMPFLKSAVGSTSSADFEPAKQVTIDAQMDDPAKTALRLSVIEGELELVYADADPAAVVTMGLAAPDLGHLVASESLTAAGVKLELFDQKTYNARMAEKRDGQGGLEEYGVGVSPAKAMTEGMNPEARQKLLSNPAFMLSMEVMVHRPKLEAGDIAMAITDPKGHLAAFEFVGADGKPLRYNRNGWFHAETPPEKRFDIYRLEGGVPEGAKLVVWLATEKSRLVLPIKLQDVPIAGRESVEGARKQ